MTTPATDAFFAAVRAGDAPAVEAFLRDDPGLVRLRDGSGVSIVCLAVYAGQREIARLLVRQRDDLDVFEASAVGDAPRVAALVDASPALVDAYSPDGFHPLGYACFFGHVDVFEVLLARGANLEAPARNAMEVRPLHSAVAHADPDVALSLARRLLESGASANATQQRGFKPLHEAALRGHLELARLLVRHGADTRARNADGKTPRGLAGENGHADLVALLT